MDEVRALLQRFWNDVAALPWQDPSWVNNPAARDATRDHFVNATTADVWNVLVKHKEETDAKTIRSNDG